MGKKLHKVVMPAHSFLAPSLPEHRSPPKTPPSFELCEHLQTSLDLRDESRSQNELDLNFYEGVTENTMTD